MQERCLLDEIISESPVKADALWDFITRMRALTGNPCAALPATIGEFKQQVRALAAAEPPLITVNDEGVITYLPQRVVVERGEAKEVERQGALFV